jgi:hypothetical protein
MSKSLINTMTADAWKNLREASGIKKTPWFLPGSTSVASKLTAWQTARVNAMAIRKSVGNLNYKFDPDDGAALEKALKALKELKTALEDMLKKAKSHEPTPAESVSLTQFVTKITAMIGEAERKSQKWKLAHDEWKKKNKSALSKVLDLVAI